MIKNGNTMKKLFSLLICSALVAHSWAISSASGSQSPTDQSDGTASTTPAGFSYQAVVRNAAGELVDNSKVGLRLTLTDQTGKQVMYQETQTVTTNSYGVLSVTVGSGTPAKGQSLSNVD